MSEPTEQQAGGFLTPLVRDEIRKRIDTARRSEKQYRKDPAFREEADAYKQYAEDYEAILTRDAEVVCISRETMAVLRVWLDRFTDREAFPSGDPFYEATLALREALEQTEASSE